MLRPWTLVGFTGHRRIEDPARIRLAIDKALALLADHGRRRLAAVSSFAIGGDTLFAEAVLARSMPWLALLPFPEQEFRKDFSPEEWARARSLLARAVSTHVEPPAADRDEGYLECGIRTVDESDVVVAVWNGKPAAGKGGTGDIIAHARSLQRPLVVIDSMSGVITTEYFDHLTPGVDPSPEELTGHAGIEHEFHRLDRAATAHAPESKHLTMVVVVLHLIASAAAAVSISVGLAGTAAYIVTGFKMGCLGIALWLVFRHRHAHHAWMNTRISAEICRSALATWPLPNPARAFPKVRVPGFESLQRTLRLLRLADPLPSADLDTIRDQYLASRVHDQIDYFDRHLAQAEPRHRLLTGAALGCTIGAFSLAFVVLVFGIYHIDGPLYTVTKSLSLVLPLLNAALLSYVVAHDLGRRVSRYREMLSILRDVQSRLAHARSWGSVERLVTETEEALMQEVLEWHSVSRFAGSAH